MARTRPLVVKLHLWLGCLVAPYLVIYAVSTWMLNREAPLPPQPASAGWSAEVAIPPQGSDEALAHRVREALGLFGHLPPWRMARDEEGRLTFVVARPGRLYEVRYDAARARADVAATHTGFASVVKGLHGLNGMGGALWPASWALYTEISLWGLVALVATGLWLDAGRLRRRRRPLAVLAAATLATAGFAVWLAAP